MPNRRGFLRGLLATGLAPSATWADAGAPKLLSAARLPNGDFVLCGISESLDIVFQIPLPARGHAAAAYPSKPHAIAFARRPGAFAVVVDCLSGEILQTVNSPPGRHFYGHGVFSQDGRWLYTTENDFEFARGIVGVWDASKNYERIAEFDSGGVGPHDISRLQDSETLVVANGGIETHPDAGRSKLNLPTMASNLSYIENGSVVETVALGPEHQRNSIRHLSVAEDGLVAFGMQWEGQGHPRSLLGSHRRGSEPSLLDQNPTNVRRLEGYVGSVAVNGSAIMATYPRGGIAQLHVPSTANAFRTIELEDVGGVARYGENFFVTTGKGNIAVLDASGDLERAKQYSLAFDNHLVAIAQPAI